MGRPNLAMPGKEEEDQRPACFGELEFLGLSPVRKTAPRLVQINGDMSLMRHSDTVFQEAD